jgi:hypothetical protein
MKTRLLCCFLSLCAVLSAAEVVVINSTGAAVLVDGKSVAAGATATVTTSDGTPYVQASTHSAVVEVIDGTRIEVDAQDVSTATPLSSYLAIIMKGFFVGMGFELGGLALALVRRIGSGTGMAAD